MLTSVPHVYGYMLETENIICIIMLPIFNLLKTDIFYEMLILSSSFPALAIINNEETFLHDFPVILKHSLQNNWKIMKTYLLGIVCSMYSNGSTMFKYIERWHIEAILTISSVTYMSTWSYDNSWMDLSLLHTDKCKIVMIQYLQRRYSRNLYILKSMKQLIRWQSCDNNSPSWKG